MIYDFTTMPDRHGKDSIAVDLQENDFWTLPKGTTRPEFDKIPMWIADMNFSTAPSVTSHISKRVAHSIFGYFVPSEEYYHSIISCTYAQSDLYWVYNPDEPQWLSNCLKPFNRR